MRNLHTSIKTDVADMVGIAISPELYKYPSPVNVFIQNG